MLEPRILLLDEPTSALDVSVQAEILNLLARLRRERGLTYVLVSHNLAIVAHLCERLLVMNAGRVVEELTAEQLRASAPAEPYTRQLLQASLGYDRQAAARSRRSTSAGTRPRHHRRAPALGAGLTRRSARWWSKALSLSTV